MTGHELIQHLEKLGLNELRYNVIFKCGGKWSPLESISTDPLIHTIDLMEGTEND